MIGGLFGTAGRRALIAAAGVIAGGVAAQAADLGGNCCADLEERVAELEATTARKGNRKVSLTVSGQVNEAVIFWDDGVEKNAYVVSNNMSRTRFRFVGDAKINADWSAGYLLEIGVRYANSGNRTANTPTAGGESNSLDIRHSAWWIDNKQLGRLWVGETSSATDGITEINLANTITAGNDPSAWGGGFFLRNSVTGAASANLTWNRITPSFAGSWAMDGDRNNVVRYVSPTLAGFIFSAAWGEDDMWDVALRYAGEFSGFRLAAGIGYKQHNDNVAKSGADGIICADLANANVNLSAVDCNTLSASGSIMHVATGLFVSGSWSRTDDQNRKALYGGSNVKDEDSHWYVVGGIEQKFFALGKTTIYGEYGNYETGAGLCAVAAAAAACGAAVGQGGILTSAGDAVIGGNRVAKIETTQWGFGLVQSIEAAAMDLYVGYKHYDTDITTMNAANVVNGKVSPKDWSAVTMGGIIRF